MLFWAIARDNLIPIFLTIGAGFIIGKTMQTEPGTLSRVIFNVFSPCLVFIGLTRTRLQANEVGLVVLVTVLSIIISGTLAWFISRLLKLNRSTTAALMIVTMFVNAGNYGLSLNELAFGEAALARALIFFVTGAAMIYSVGVFIASSGKASVGVALRQTLRIPAIYAVVAALIVVSLDIVIPSPIATPIEWLAEGAIPAMLVLLGIQMAKVQNLERLPLVGVASVLRLIVGSMVALGLAALFGMSGPTRQAVVLEASMPTAVFTTILAIEYELEPTFVTSTVMVSTLLSPFSLTALVALLS